MIANTLTADQIATIEKARRKTEAYTTALSPLHPELANCLIQLTDYRGRISYFANALTNATEEELTYLKQSFKAMSKLIDAENEDRDPRAVS